MAYPSFSFPLGTSPFPPASVILKYLGDYAAHFDLLRYVRLCTSVEKICWNTDSSEWDVTLSTGEGLEFDFVVVANGHYRKPRYPDTAGLQSWLDSGRAIHSAWFRRPDEFAHHKKVMLVGGGPSAVDICTDMTGVVPLLLHSIPRPTPNGALAYPDNTENYRKMGRVAEYRDDGSVLLVDGSTESDIDMVLLATGYEISFPFLSQINSGIPSLPPPLPSELYNSTYHVFPLAYELFPLQGKFPPTSIAFPGLLYRVAPFPIFEEQARAIARVLEIPESLDTLSCAVDIMTRAHELIREEGTDDPLLIAKRWPRYAKLERFEYRARLHAFVGENWTAPDWEIECWKNKYEIRREWIAIEKSGKAEEWLKGVGTNGLEDWIELCRRLIKQSEVPSRL
jgi:Flavin-binding monooxygenase-like